MKNRIVLAVLFILSLSISACSQIEGSFSDDSRSEESTASNFSSSSEQSSKSSAYSYDFPQKEQGLTLEQITEEVDKLEAQEGRPVRYTYHIEEKLTGTYPMTMKDGSAMVEGEYSLDMVIEAENSNDNMHLKVISGTPTTRIQATYTSYSSSITPKGWLSYQKQRRNASAKNAQEGEGFDERFYTGPLTLWMIIWGVRVPNANIDGTYFGLEEFERTYNAEGYCVTFKVHEFSYMKGTLTSFMNGTHEYDGTYEYTSNCTIEYLD